MIAPLVSVICVCYNHAPFLREALDSVLNQTYTNVEIIIIDDFSTDNSIDIIKEYLKKYPDIQFIQNAENIGNCKSFNKAFKLSKGNLIIDFSTDDVLHTDRIAKQVEMLGKADQTYGVVYSDTEVISADSKFLYNHFENLGKYQLVEIPQGDIYKVLLEKFLLPTTSMMMRREVLEELGGYDETLSYEDFDFWIRSSRKYKYIYIPEVLTKRRLSPHSFSIGFITPVGKRLHWSTYRVCQKALWLNKTKEENDALIRRVEAEVKQVFFLELFELVQSYYKLLEDAGLHSSTVKSYYKLSKKKIRLNWFYKLVKKIKG